MSVSKAVTARTDSPFAQNHEDILLTVDNISVSASAWQHTDDKLLLNNVSFTLARGQLISVIGPNGGGKSTLIKAVAGLLPIASGTLLKSNNLKIALLPQHFTVPQSLPMRAMDYFELSGYKHTNTQDAFTVSTSDPVLADAFEKLALTPLLKKPMQALSGGERQRVLLASSLMKQPDLLLLDEPMQGVDAASARMLYDMVDELSKHMSCGVLIVSHDLGWVMAGAHHVLCINTHVCCQGSPQSVQASPEFQALFTPVYAHSHI